MRGFVSLVGAGPGDPELITVKGLRRLRAADVVVYDALASAELLRECRAEAELIEAGKRGGQPSAAQEEINALLVARARAGLQVVRLKGGDPFVFGRGGEEAEALQAAGVPWEVVPGVSSAVGVPAYAGIPLTHRGRASSFAVVTGHAAGGSSAAHTDLAALARGADTLVVLMGVGRLAQLAEQIVSAGRPADTPAAVIQWGTTADQETVVGTLATIAGEVHRAGLGAPAVLVVGEVVQLRERLRWFDTLFATEGAERTEQGEAARPVSPSVFSVPSVAEM
ncbi:MAG TPA: uroporphyrinogen-III C-methyltransferase [Roseiflexaceae bacterium]|nr:uroporphyrinogen-III C-methyltransferase [Roseiflexaceae bacterium]